MTLSVVILALVTLQRLGELVLAKRNTRACWRGALEIGAGHYPLIVGLHAAWLVGLWVLAWDRPVSLVLARALPAPAAAARLGHRHASAAAGRRGSSSFRARP